MSEYPFETCDNIHVLYLTFRFLKNALLKRLCLSLSKKCLMCLSQEKGCYTVQLFSYSKASCLVITSWYSTCTVHVTNVVVACKKQILIMAYFG